MAILNEHTVDFISNGMEQTVRLGTRLGQLLQPYDLVCLSGDLGAGKTVLARGVARGWGSLARVTSPTFTLVNMYPRELDGRSLYHLDAYRLNSDGEIITTGLDDIVDTIGVVADGAVLIEWPEQVARFLPKDRLWVTLTHLDETRRQLRFEATGERSSFLLDAFKKKAFGI